MKLVLAVNDRLYRALVQSFPYYNDEGLLIGSYFSESEFDNFRLVDKDYIGVFINPIDGIRDIDTILIQKSWYSDIDCINIALFFKKFRPETNVVFLLDSKDTSSRYFCHRVTTEHLAFVSSIYKEDSYDFTELNALFDEGFNVDQSTTYALPDNIKKKELRQLKKEFNAKLAD